LSCYESSERLWDGTHWDEVAEAAEYIRISGLVDATLLRSLAWPSVVEYEAAGLEYIPVDCTLGADDLTMAQLMACIERSIRESVYISIKRLLSWYNTLDALQKQTSPMIIFRDMGVIMCYDTTSLASMNSLFLIR
jgi:hypothetical protein